MRVCARLDPAARILALLRREAAAHSDGAMQQPGFGEARRGGDACSVRPPSGAARFTYRETVIIIVGLMLGMFLSALAQTIVATALPRIASDHHDDALLSLAASSSRLRPSAGSPSAQQRSHLS